MVVDGFDMSVYAFKAMKIKSKQKIISHCWGPLLHELHCFIRCMITILFRFHIFFFIVHRHHHSAPSAINLTRARKEIQTIIMCLCVCSWCHFWNFDREKKRKKTNYNVIVLTCCTTLYSILFGRNLINFIHISWLAF